MSSSRPPRLKDAPSGIVGEVPSRIRTPSPTRKDSPSQPPTGLRSPSPTREVAPAPGRGRIPALAVRVMIAVGHLNGVDCLHLLRVNRELRSMGQSEAFWKSFLPYSLVERAKGDMSLLQRDFVVVALPLALAERVAKAIVVVRAAGDAAPKFPEDVALLLKKQQPVDPYFVKALVLATYLRYGELGEMGHERVIYMGHDFLTCVSPFVPPWQRVTEGLLAAMLFHATPSPPWPLRPCNGRTVKWSKLVCARSSRPWPCIGASCPSICRRPCVTCAT